MAGTAMVEPSAIVIVPPASAMSCIIEPPGITTASGVVASASTVTIGAAGRCCLVRPWAGIHWVRRVGMAYSVSRR